MSPPSASAQSAANDLEIHDGKLPTTTQFFDPQRTTAPERALLVEETVASDIAPHCASTDPKTMTKRRRIRVGIVSDVRLYRDGIAQSLSSREVLHVMGTAPDRVGALTLGETLREDILLLDVAMADSLSIIRSLADELPDLKIVGFALDEVEDDIVACAEAGIVGYVSRDASLETLVEVLESASRNELICSPQIASRLLRRLAVKPGSVGHPAEALLTRREREIWQALDRGLANKEIATEFGIEVTTAKNHVHNLLAKLEVSSRAEAAALRHRRNATLPSRRRRPRAAL